MSDDWFDGYTAGGFLPEPSNTGQERLLSAYVQGYADCAGSEGQQVRQARWEGLADGLQAGYAWGPAFGTHQMWSRSLRSRPR